MYKKLQASISSDSPMLFHNSQLADPTSKFTKAIKEITAKGKKKTDKDLEDLAKLEFMGGLYLDDKGHPAVPGENIEGMIRDGAKKSRKGKDVQCGVISDGVWPLVYDGPKDPEALWLDERFRGPRIVRVGQSRVLRMRPKFPIWSLVFEVAFEDEIANASDVIKWIEDAGRFCGLCDGRPRYGRFSLLSTK